MRCDVIYEDEDLIVIHKPAGLATQSSFVGQPDAVSELKSHLARKGGGKAPYLGVVHRLDQPVEGLLVFAKTPRAAAGLSKQLTRGTLHKTYLAAVCGTPPSQEGELLDFLRKEGSVARVVTGREGQYPDAKQARLFYRVLQVPDGSLTVLEVRIETGRFHQIRAQLAHAGWPILGDQKYGTEASASLARQRGISSVALCASRLSLRHPVTQKDLSWSFEPAWQKQLKNEKERS